MKTKLYPFPTLDVKETFFTNTDTVGIEALSLGEQRKLIKGCCHISSFYRLVSDPNHLFFGVYAIERQAVGSRVFNKTYCTGRFVIGKTGVFNYGALELRDYRWVCEHLRVEWFSNELQVVKSIPMVASKLVLKAVFTKKITNKESLYKYILKTRYHAFNVIGWRQLEGYMKTSLCGISLYDVLDFTTNPKDSLQVLLRDSADNSTLILYKDILKAATFLDQKINLAWSRKRLENVHHEQNLILSAVDLEKTDKTSIYTEDAFKGLCPEFAKVLTSEYEVAFTGINLSNCIYHSYWESIKGYRYLAILFNVDGKDALLGVRKAFNADELEFDQCYGFKNSNISDRTRMVVDAFIAYTSEELWEILRTSEYVSELENTYKTPENTLKEIDNPFDF